MPDPKQQRFLSAISRKEGELEGFPWTVPAVRALRELEFRAAVTFFVGENGSGKSTVLEGIAAGAGAIAVGSAEIEQDPSLDAARRFANAYRFVRRERPQTRLFFRAEDVFGFTRRVLANMQDLGAIEDEFKEEFPEGSTARNLAVGSVRSQKLELVERYGPNPDGRSHGELFLRLLASRLVPRGLYLLDEPEAPLSPRSILELIALIRDRVEQGCQFVIATHSSMLLALPDAAILEFTSEAIRERSYDELEQVALERSFLQAPDRFLRHL